MFYPMPKPLSATASGNKAGITVKQGAAWLPVDHAPNPSVPPAGFSSFPYMVDFFWRFNGPNASKGTIYSVSNSQNFTLASPLFGCLAISGGNTPLYGWLYMPVTAIFLARHILAQYVPTAPMGPNIGPVLTMPQIAQFQLQYVAISLNTAIQPPSTHSGLMNMNGYKGLTLLI